MQRFLVITLFFLFFAFFWIPQGAIGQGQEEFKLEVRVDHIAGRLEKLKEKLTLFFKFNKKDKTRYYQFLAGKRLAELSYIIENNQIKFVEETASRYSTYIGTLTNFVVKNKVSSEKEELLKMFDRHIKIIEGLQRRFKFESGWWLAIQHDINSAKLFRDKIKELN